MIQLDDFTRGYIECMLWAERADPTDDADDLSFEWHGYNETDLAPETMADIIQDCADFQHYNAADLEAYAERKGDHPEYTAIACAGHDFWLTRNGHGAGFWDRGLGEVGDRLTSAAKVYGSRNPYLGDDGLIYCE